MTFPRGRFADALTVLLALALAPAAAASTARGFDVIAYRAQLVPDLAARSLAGHETIVLESTRRDLSMLEFDAGGLVVDSVALRGRPLLFARKDRKLAVTLPVPLAEGRRVELELRYHGTPTHGLQFHPEAAQLYTIFSTSEWLVTIDAPDERATLDLSVVLPAEFRATGNGTRVARRRLGDDRVVHRWKQREPVPSFAYGFAAGRFGEVEVVSRGVRSRVLSRTLDAAQARKLFGNTGEMLAFFGERAGAPYRGRYDQVLVVETIGQEAAGFAMLSEEYGKAVLAGEGTEELIAHEAAHQWWGIGTTCSSWGEFWLNEAFANFMAAAWMQQKHGEPLYQAAVARWKARLEKLRADGKDHALVYERWIKPTRDDRAVVYQKGAYVLHLLRQELGEKAFWSGLREYSRRFSGASVRTQDFKAAMERSSGRDLDAFFAQWVTGTAR